MTKQKTALQELIEFVNEMKTTQTLINGCDIETIHIPSLLHKCKEMVEKEKKQMVDAIVSAIGLNHASPTDDNTLEDFEKYYSQTYTSNKNS